jgi:hypothetical protein
MSTARETLLGQALTLLKGVMSTADGGQIIVGQPVFETLSQREKYLSAFRSYTAKIKHGALLPVHQLVEPTHPGLNTDTPTQFRYVSTPEAELTKVAAYYMAHAIRGREFLKKNLRHGQEAYAGVLLLYFLAMDSVSKSETSELDPPSNPRIWGDAGTTFDKRFAYYCGIHFWLCCETSGFITANCLRGYEDCFERGGAGFEWHFPNKKGKDKVKKEWPQIWNEFGFDVPPAS